MKASRIKLFGVIAVFLLSLIVSIGLVSALEADLVKKVEINKRDMTDITSLRVDRGDVLEVELRIEPSENVTDVQGDVIIGTFEYAKEEEGTYCSISRFDMDAGDTEFRTCTVTVPEKIEKKYADLRIRLFTDQGASFEKLVGLHIKGVNHQLNIEDVIVIDPVKAGRGMRAQVFVENVGENDENDVEVILEAFGNKARARIDEVEEDESASTEDMLLSIPCDAEAGEAEGKVTIVYRDGHASEEGRFTFQVRESTVCDRIMVAEGASEVAIVTDVQDVTARGAFYPVSIVNKGPTSQTYTVSADVGDWGTARISPSNMVTVGSGEIEVVHVYVSAKEDAAAGEHDFIITVKSGDKTVAEQILTANVLGSESAGWDKLKKGLEIGLVVLVILLVVLGLIIGFSKLKSDEDEESKEEAGQTYY